MRRSLLIVVAGIACTFAGGAPASAACGPENTLFWKSTAVGSLTATGNQQELQIRHESLWSVGCVSGNDVHGGTAHLTGPDAGTNLAEIGWRERATSNSGSGGGHTYRVFTETFEGGVLAGLEYFTTADLQSLDPSCPALTNYTWLLVKVARTSTGKWAYFVGCPAGWIEIESDMTQWDQGLARVESFRWGYGTSGISYHRNMRYRRDDGSWSNTFVSLACAQDSMDQYRGDLTTMTGSYFKVETDPDGQTSSIGTNCQ